MVIHPSTSDGRRVTRATSICILITLVSKCSHGWVTCFLGSSTQAVGIWIGGPWLDYCMTVQMGASGAHAGRATIHEELVHWTQSPSMPRTMD